MRRRHLDNGEHDGGKLSGNKLIKLRHHHDGHLLKDHLSQGTDKLVPHISQAVDGSDVNLNNGSIRGKHLVRTISDLPVFVPIEGHFMAAYMLDGEPYLCLPQLLRQIQLEFPLDRVIEIFEETITNFSTATLKQVEGFIKSNVLPPNATSCPLICRSSADRVCLRLYDQLGKGYHRYNTVDLCLKSGGRDSRCDEYLQSNETEKNCSSKASEQEPGQKASSRNESPLNIDEDSRVREEELTDGACKESEMDDLGLCRRVKPPMTTSDHKEQLHNDLDLSLKSNQRIHNSETRKLSTESNHSIQEQKPKLFEKEAQNAILDLARAATSTLMIQIYHKCFGKCTGFYHPKLLKTADSECIECDTCHALLSPRRFVGHMHGNREVNVCHWGFNSYNWRHYLKLSQRQSMNNLDEDELVIRFRQLLSIPKSENEYPDETFGSMHEHEDTVSCQMDKIKSANVSSLSNQVKDFLMNNPGPFYGSNGFMHEKLGSYNQAIIPMMAKIQYPTPPRDKMKSLVTGDFTSENHDRYSSRSFPLVANKYNTSHYSQASTNSLPSCSQPEQPNNQLGIGKSLSFRSALNQVFPRHSSSTMVQLSRLNDSNSSFDISSNMRLSNGFDMRTHCLNSSSGATFLSSEDQKSMPGPFDPHHLAKQKDVSERELKKDLFVSTNLANYLSSRHIDSEVMKDIVSCTLDLIDKSRKLF